MTLSNKRLGITAISLISVIFITFLCFSNTLDASWQFDDEPQILLNEKIHINEFTIKNIKNILYIKANELPINAAKYRDDNTIYIQRPISYLSFALNWKFGEDKVFGYHLINILIHLANVLLLYFIIFQLLTIHDKTKQISYKNKLLLSSICALFWGINPITVQAVTYIVQRMALLSGFFYLSSIYLFLKTFRSNNNFIKFSSLAIIFLLMILGYLSKENAILIPAGILLVFILFKKNGLISFKNNSPQKNILLALLGLCVVLLLIIIFLNYLPSLNYSYNIRPWTMKERLLTQCNVVLNYLYSIFVPILHNFSLEHQYTISKSLINPLTTLFSLLAITALIVIAILGRKAQPFLSLAIGFFFINHLTESTIFPIEMVHEHRNYIPSCFLFLPIALFSFNLMKSSIGKAILFTSFACYLFMLGNVTYTLNKVWKTEESLWLHASNVAPDRSRPKHYLGQYYINNGNFSYGIKLLEQAAELPAEIRPDYNKRKLYSEIARLYYETGLFDKSIMYSDKALKIYNQIYFDYQPYLDVFYVMIKSQYETGNIETAKHLLNLIKQKRPLRAEELQIETLITTPAQIKT